MRILLAERPVGETFAPDLKQIWERDGHQVDYGADGSIHPSAGGVLCIVGNINWFPRLGRWLEKTPPVERPFIALWHYEPLPPPRAAGLPRPRLSLAEIAKIALRDPRATDVFSNFSHLRSLVRRGIPDLVMVTTEGRREYLAERGIESQWVPLGWVSRFGRPLGRQRDIDVLFLGARNVPRRLQILRRLARSGLRVVEAGDWNDPACWGEPRVELLNRARILLN
ncbi:MAG: hypothetical protein ACRD96_20970, partial [Bryobacteraceae bacterium]